MSADEKAQEITRQEYKEWLESRVTQFVAGTLAQMRVSHADHFKVIHWLRMQRGVLTGKWVIFRESVSS